MMRTERIEPKKLTGARFAGIMVLVVAALMASLWLSRLLARMTGIGIFDAVFLICAAAIIVLLMRGTVIGYGYTLTERGSIVLEKDYGDKVNSLLEVKAADIDQVRPYTQGENLKKTYRTVTRFCPAGRATHVLVYRQGGKTHAALFAPTDAMRADIEEAAGHAG